VDSLEGNPPVGRRVVAVGATAIIDAFHDSVLCLDNYSSAKI
jgi:hypothetical protein